MKLLVVVDMQTDFIDGALGTPEAQAIVPNVIKKIKEYKENGGVVLYTRDTHRSPEHYLETIEGRNLPVPHCIAGTKGWEIPEEIATKNDVCINKHTFGSTILPHYILEHYTDAHYDIDSIEIIGLCTDICVISNAMILKAYFETIPIIIDSSCCAGVTPVSHQNALEAMKMCQIKVV